MLGAAGLAGLLGLALLPAAASAQGLPAICDDYPDLPVCATEIDNPPQPVDNPPSPDGEPSDDDDDLGPVELAATPSAGAGGGGGTLPFTGYPLTPLLLLLLLLLATGLAIRAWLAYRDRRLAARGAGEQPGPPLGA